MKVASRVFDDAMKNELAVDGYFTAEQPMNVVVDDDTYFDVWLDGEDQIRPGHLYTHEEY